MSIVHLSSLTHDELVRVFVPETDRERLLHDRLSEKDPYSEIEDLTEECNSLEKDNESLDDEINTLSAGIEALLEFFDGESSKEEVEKDQRYIKAMQVARI